MSSPAKRIINNWTDEQRTVLYLLNKHPTFEAFDLSTRTRIFNFMFNDELQACGIAHGLGEVALHSQYRDRIRKDREHLWTNVIRGPQTSAEEREREELVERINDAVTTLGVARKDEDVTEAQDGDGEEDDSELEIPRKKGKTPIKAPNESVLDMLHYKELDWDANRPSIDSLHNAAINHSSPVYAHGGQVHRVVVESDNLEADFMVCGSRICANCWDTADPTLHSETEGLPFVHSSDTIMDQKHTYFRPKPKAHSSERPKHFRRLVQFKGVNGDVSCWVRICGNIGCEVCMGGNMQRRATLRATYGLEGVVGDEDEEAMEE